MSLFSGNNNNNNNKDSENSNKTFSQRADDLLKTSLEVLSGKGTDTKLKLVDNILGFIGSAGGVGTSTVVSNLAYLASKRGLTVLLIDLNIMFPTIPYLFDIRYTENQPDLVSFLQGKNEIGESIVNKGNLSILASHDRVLYNYLDLDSKNASENLERAFRKIKYQFDVIMIDCPLDLSFDIVGTALYHSDAYYTVWDEGINCVANFDTLSRSLAAQGVTPKRFKVILNKKTDVFYPKRIFNTLELPLLGVLPFDTKIIESGLNSEIYLEKGTNFTPQSKTYCTNLGNILDEILRLGGYERSVKDLGKEKSVKKEKKKKVDVDKLEELETKDK